MLAKYQFLFIYFFPELLEIISLKFITRQVRHDAREILEIVIENFKCRRYVCTSFKGEDSKSWSSNGVSSTRGTM